MAKKAGKAWWYTSRTHKIGKRERKGIPAYKRIPYRYPSTPKLRRG